MQKNFNIELTVFLIFCLFVILSEQPVRSFKYVNCDSIFLSEFFFKETDKSYDTRGKEGTIFTPPYHYDLLTDIHTFVWSFTVEMTITYF